ncbi:hypothetical protein [Streptomyces sp. NPDC003299]
MEVYVDDLLALADKIKTIREAVRKDSDSLYRRLQRAGYVRRLWKQTEETLPELITEAYYAADRTVADIADDLSVSESYVYRVLRERARYEWRLDLYDSETGPGWQRWEEGTDVVDRKTFNQVELAECILAAAGKGPQNHRARVLIWEGKQGRDDEALYVHEQDPTQ